MQSSLQKQMSVCLHVSALACVFLLHSEAPEIRVLPSSCNFLLTKSVALIGGTVKLKEDCAFSENVEGVYSSVNHGKHRQYF